MVWFYVNKVKKPTKASPPMRTCGKRIDFNYKSPTLAISAPTISLMILIKQGSIFCFCFTFQNLYCIKQYNCI